MDNPAPELYRMVTANLRMMPDFIIIGAQKGGTTSLYNFLGKHPCVISATTKEVHYFDNMDHNFRYGMNWYRAHFPTQLRRTYRKWVNQQRILTGESSPYYIFHPLVPKRVFEASPKAKLIALLRDPVERAYSHYQHNVRMGREPLSFEAALQQEEERLQGEQEKLLADEAYFSYPHAHYSYKARGVYVKQLKAWHEFFPREQLLVLKSEDLYIDPGKIFGQVLAFLQLPDWKLNKYSKYNASGGYAGMSPDTRAQLTAYFRPYNQALYDYLNVEYGWTE